MQGLYAFNEPDGALQLYRLQMMGYLVLSLSCCRFRCL